MIVLPNRNSATNVEIVAALRAARDLTTEEKAIFKKEISGERYAGKTDAEIMALLCLPYTVPNPEPQGRISLPSIPASAIRRFVSGGLARVKSDPTLSAKWIPQLPILFGLLTDPVDLSDPDPTLHGSLQDAIADGIFSANDWSDLTTVPDETWQAEWEHDPPASALLDLRWVILDLADVAAIKAA